MITNDPQVPWTDEQWARVNRVIQEEASRARGAATFLPLIGPLPGDTDFVRRGDIFYTEPPNVLQAALVDIAQATVNFNAAMGMVPPDIGRALAAQQLIANAQAIVQRQRITIDDKRTIQLATLQVKVPVRGAQMADPEMTSVLALFRRAANVLARLEDAVVFRGLRADPTLPGRVIPRAGVAGLPGIWEITGGQVSNGLWTRAAPWRRWVYIQWWPSRGRDTRLVRGIAQAIGRLEAAGHFGPFAVVLDQRLFLVAETPSLALVLPQDRIIPFLGGGPLLRSSTLDHRRIGAGVVVALGGAAVELVVATDVCLQFLQLTAEPVFVFRVCEKMALRIKEPEAIIQLASW